MAHSTWLGRQNRSARWSPGKDNQTHIPRAAPLMMCRQKWVGQEEAFHLPLIVNLNIWKCIRHPGSFQQLQTLPGLFVLHCESLWTSLSRCYSTIHPQILNLEQLNPWQRIMHIYQALYTRHVRLIFHFMSRRLKWQDWDKRYVRLWKWESS